MRREDLRVADDESVYYCHSDDNGDVYHDTPPRPVTDADLASLGLVALDGIDVEALRAAHFMVKKQVDPAIPNRPSVLVGWDAETVQTLIEQVLAAIDGEDTPRD